MIKAKFLTRFWAWLVDGVLLAIVTSAITAGITYFINASARAEGGFMSFFTAWLAIFLAIVIFLLQFLYFGVLWSGGGQSLGMKLFKIKVLQRSGDRVSFLRAAFRGTIGYWISGLFFFLGYIWAAFDREKEAWHDKIFATTVVEA